MRFESIDITHVRRSEAVMNVLHHRDRIAEVVARLSSATSNTEERSRLSKQLSEQIMQCAQWQDALARLREHDMQGLHG